jgi:hypothetical protein
LKENQHSRREWKKQRITYQKAYRMAGRHRKGKEKFKQVRRLKDVHAYYEPEENSYLLPPPENYKPPIFISRIGWDPEERPKRGTKGWLFVKGDC